MSRDAVIESLEHYFDDGGFWTDLARRVAIRSCSQDEPFRPELYRYLKEEMTPYLADLGFVSEIFENPKPGGQPILVARRQEGDDLPTLMTYGHGDVVRGYDDQWRDGIGPWEMKKVGDRWYGRGTADNKGQHTINLAALKACMDARGGKLGYNVVALIETGEETGSPGLREFCRAHSDLFKADVFIASDGPRLNALRPTVYFGSRGVFNFTMSLDLRDGGHHSGNWGGLLANPGIILASALATVIDVKGRILVPALLPPPITDTVKGLLADVTRETSTGGPAIDDDWGEPGLTRAEKVYAWNTFEILAMKTGNPDNPVHAVPPKAVAHCQLRFVVGTDWQNIVANLQAHLDAAGFGIVKVQPSTGGNAAFFHAARTDPDHPWARWMRAAVERTTGERCRMVPNSGGSICNDVFQDVLGIPFVWLPLSYTGCSQHAPNEHILWSLTREGMELVTGVYWDLGDPETRYAA